jgi:hypothetical protein
MVEADNAMIAEQCAQRIAQSIQS